MPKTVKISKPHQEDTRSKTTQAVEELAQLAKESREQRLPEQKVVFKTDSIKSRAGRRGVHNLPDQTNPPMGFDPDKAFDAVFPFLKLPYLQPNTPEDVISFGSSDAGGFLDPKAKKVPLNAIFFGDNLHVLRALPSNSIDLIYIDPPFFSGRNYNQLWGDDNEIRTFHDIWEDGLPSYLVWLNARLWEMRRVLKNTGSIYVHCDWHASHYIKAEMDKIFGYQHLQSEIVWKRSVAHSDNSTLGNVHDTIFFYSKGDETKWNASFIPYDEEYIEQYYRYKDPDGRRWKSSDLTAPGGRGPVYTWKGVKRAWRHTEENMKKLEAQERIFYTRNGIPRFKQFLDEMPGMPLQSFWSDKAVRPINSWHKESIGYPTQKPEGLLERIIVSSSDAGDIIADFFMGGGTTCAVAQKLNRRFIGCDISRVASSVALNRLIKDAEDISGRTASLKTEGAAKETQLSLELTIKKVPDIRVYYMGVYPIEKFAFISQRDFEDFILTCYDARRFTGEGDITGVMNASISILIGSVKPDDSISEERLKRFVSDVMRLRYQENVRLRLKVIAWVFPPTLQRYAKVLENYFSHKNVPVEIELIPINSQLFRNRILEHYPDASKGEFLLKFVSQPSIMDIAYKKISGLKYRFEAIGARSNNIDGRLINCQWDFNYMGNHFGESEYALMREQKDGKYVAVLKAEKEFEKQRKHLVACRVQDNLGGEAVRTKEIEVR